MRVFGKPGNSRDMIAAAVCDIDTDLILCWGAKHHPEFGDRAINNCPRLNATEQLYQMGMAGVPTIEWTTRIEDAIAAVQAGQLVFGRKLIHSQGTDIVGPRHPKWRRREYWTKVVPNVEEEWRIHVFNGRSIARGLKVQVEPPRRKMPVRNRANGWRMVHDIDPSEDLRSTAKAAVAALGYQFGAVDILVDRDGRLYVLECNRAPGLDEYTCAQYAEAVRRFVRRDARLRGEDAA